MEDKYCPKCRNKVEHHQANCSICDADLLSVENKKSAIIRLPKFSRLLRDPSTNHVKIPKLIGVIVAIVVVSFLIFGMIMEINITTKYLMLRTVPFDGDVTGNYTIELTLTAHNVSFIGLDGDEDSPDVLDVKINSTALSYLESKTLTLYYTRLRVSRHYKYKNSPVFIHNTLDYDINYTISINTTDTTLESYQLKIVHNYMDRRTETFTMMFIQISFFSILLPILAVQYSPKFTPKGEKKWKAIKDKAEEIKEVKRASRRGEIDDQQKAESLTKLKAEKVELKNSIPRRYNKSIEQPDLMRKPDNLRVLIILILMIITFVYIIIAAWAVFVFDSWPL